MTPRDIPGMTRKVPLSRSLAVRRFVSASVRHRPRERGKASSGESRGILSHEVFTLSFGTQRKRGRERKGIDGKGERERKRDMKGDVEGLEGWTTERMRKQIGERKADGNGERKTDKRSKRGICNERVGGERDQR